MKQLAKMTTLQKKLNCFKKKFEDLNASEKKILTINKMKNIKKEEANKQLKNLSGKLMKDSNRLIYSVENIIGTFYIKCKNQL